MTTLSKDINAVILQFLDKENESDRETWYNYLEYYYQTLLEETGDYKEYRKI